MSLSRLNNAVTGIPAGLIVDIGAREFHTNALVVIQIRQSLVSGAALFG